MRYASARFTSSSSPDFRAACSSSIPFNVRSWLPPSDSIMNSNSFFPRSKCTAAEHFDLGKKLFEFIMESEGGSQDLTLKGIEELQAALKSGLDDEVKRAEAYRMLAHMAGVYVSQ